MDTGLKAGRWYQVDNGEPQLWLTLTALFAGSGVLSLFMVVLAKIARWIPLL